MDIPENEQTYGSILTLAGEINEQQGVLLNRQLEFTHIAIGDANDTYVQPTRTQTALVNEVARITVNSVDVVQATAEAVPILKVTAILPDDVNEIIIREVAAVATFNGASYFHAVGNTARVYIPTPANNGGVAIPVIIEMIFSITSAQPILQIDPNIVIATREWVLDQINESAPDGDGSGFLQNSDRATNAQITAGTALKIPDAAQLRTELNTKLNANLRGVRNGVAPLDENSDVPIANLPTATASQITAGTAGRLVDAAQLRIVSNAASSAIPLAQKAARNGVASLDNNIKIPIEQIPTATAAQAAAGQANLLIDGSQLLTGLNTKINTTSRGATNGVAPLDASSKLPVANFHKAANAQVTAGTADVFPDCAQLRAAIGNISGGIPVAEKGSANGVAPLDTNRLVPLANLQTATSARLGITQLNDTLTSSSTSQALTARQGRILAERISNNSLTKTLLYSSNANSQSVISLSQPATNFDLIEVVSTETAGGIVYQTAFVSNQTITNANGRPIFLNSVSASVNSAGTFNNARNIITISFQNQTAVRAIYGIKF